MIENSSDLPQLTASPLIMRIKSIENREISNRNRSNEDSITKILCYKISTIHTIIKELMISYS